MSTLCVFTCINKLFIHYHQVPHGYRIAPNRSFFNASSAVVTRASFPHGRSRRCLGRNDTPRSLCDAYYAALIMRGDLGFQYRVPGSGKTREFRLSFPVLIPGFEVRIPGFKSVCFNGQIAWIWDEVKSFQLTYKVVISAGSQISCIQWCNSKLCCYLRSIRPF